MRYDQVFNSGKRPELGGFYDTGATVFQDAKVFTDFQEYLDRYLDPTFRNVWPIQLSHTPRHVVLLGRDRTSANMVSTFTQMRRKEHSSGSDADSSEGFQGGVEDTARTDQHHGAIAPMIG